jgi:predicted membrane protein
MQQFFWGMLFIIIGIIFLLDNFGYASAGEIIHDYWPLVFVLWGISILVRKGSPAPKVERNDHRDDHVSSDLFHQSNVFGDLTLNISSKNFKGGSISTVFGDCDSDLTDMTIAEGEHALHLHSVFGDSLIRIRKESAVKLTANSTFGKLLISGERKSQLSSAAPYISPAYVTSTNKLTISVSKVFGDIRIEIV